MYILTHFLQRTINKNSNKLEHFDLNFFLFILILKTIFNNTFSLPQAMVGNYNLSSLP